MSAFPQDRTQERVRKLHQYLETLTDAVIAQTKMARTPEDIRMHIRDFLKEFALEVSMDGLKEVGEYGTNTHTYAVLKSYYEMLRRV